MITDKFPVYKHEKGNVYFQYSSWHKQFFFSIHSASYDSYIGLGADADSYKMQDPNRWVYLSAGAHDNIFGNIITRWFQQFYPPSNTIKHYLDSQLVAKCVNFTDCGYTDLAFSQYYGDQLSVDVFKIFGNVVKNYRQVYVHSTRKRFLFFDNNYWNIGEDYNSGLVKWSVDDQALKPEFITSVWKKWSSAKWEYQYGARVECHGVNKTCTELKCQNYSPCGSDTFNNSFCSCPFNYSGTKCENRIQRFCPKTSFTKFSRSPRALESIFCQAGTFYNVLCKKNIRTNALEWVSDSKCEAYLSTTSSTPAIQMYMTKNKQSKQQPSKNSFTVYVALAISIVSAVLFTIGWTSRRRQISLVSYICKYIVLLIWGIFFKYYLCVPQALKFQIHGNETEVSY